MYFPFPKLSYAYTCVLYTPASVLWSVMFTWYTHVVPSCCFVPFAAVDVCQLPCMSSWPFASVHVGNCTLFTPDPASFTPYTYTSYPAAVTFFISAPVDVGAALSMFVMFAYVSSPAFVPSHKRAYIVPFSV